MAQSFPLLVVLKCGLDYAFFTHANGCVRGYVSCTGKSVFEPYAKIAAERSTTNTNFVHLRFCATNQYMARPDPNNRLLVAGSNQPEEDATKTTCMLFKPVVAAGQTVYFIHVQTGLPVSKDACNSLLCVDKFLEQTTFGFTDWETLVELPKHVAFKGYNDKYVDVRLTNREWLRGLSDDGNTGAASFEVQMSPDGFLRFRCLQNDAFWVLIADHWMAADSHDKTDADINTLFSAVRVNHNTVALRAEGNHKFIVVQRVDAAWLSAEVSTITSEARFRLEELVLERSIYNTRYRMEDSRIYNETPFVAGTGSASNDSDTASELTIIVDYQETTSFTFSNSVSVTLGVSTEFTAGIPYIAESKIHISAEVTSSLEWNRTKTETRSMSAQYKVMAPPMSVVHVDYVATRGTCNVPFSYTQRDVSSTDGQVILSERVDGVFNCVSCYNHRFNQPCIRSLRQLDE